ncbi:MAG TPA: hypothetical protein VMT85_13755 [Thermoanaerobaculia bacterium]|nr:hypothetical protein [Thermoanaerobaculia bacterium]
MAKLGGRAEKLWRERRWAAVLLLVVVLGALNALTHWVGSKL